MTKARGRKIRNILGIYFGVVISLQGNLIYGLVHQRYFFYDDIAFIEAKSPFITQTVSFKEEIGIQQDALTKGKFIFDR